MKIGVRVGAPVGASPKKSPAKPKQMLPRAKSFSTKSSVKNIESYQFPSRRALSNGFLTGTVPTPKARNSDSGIKLPGLHIDVNRSSPRLDALKLPKTEPPVIAITYTIKKRFADIEKTLERIPSEDWLGSLLYSRPGFKNVLEANRQKCKSKLSKLKLVQAAISEEDGDMSEHNIRGLIEEIA